MCRHGSMDMIVDSRKLINLKQTDTNDYAHTQYTTQTHTPTFAIDAR